MLNSSFFVSENVGAGFILAGNEASRTTYIDTFIQEHHIKSYNAISYKDKVKISDAQAIKKFLSTKQSENEKKLVILFNTATLDAQNTLLKILEELPENTYFIWSLGNLDAILTTIQSRCKIIRFQSTMKLDTSKYESLITELLGAGNKNHSTLSSVLRIASEVSSSQADVENFILGLRKQLIEAADLDDSSALLLLSRLIEKLQYYYPLMIQNNINKRFLMENVLISTINSLP